VVYFVAFRRRWGAIALLAVVALSPPQRPLGSKVLPGGTVMREREIRDTPYAEARVVDYSYGPHATREMVVNGQIQGGIDLVSGLSLFAYSYAMERIPVALYPEGKRCLVVGVGAGMIPRWYEARGIATDVVDIDPEIVDMARRQFGFAPAGRVYIDDARHVLNSTETTYDYVIIDVFAGDTSPGHVLTLEALRSAARVLSPRGVLALNLIGPTGRRGVVPASIVRTLRQVFDTVEVHPLFRPPDSSGSLEIVAYRGPPRTYVRDGVDRDPVYPAAAPAVAGMWETYEFPTDTPSMVLTDDHEPTDVIDLEFKEELRGQFNKGRSDWDAGS
jgi:spermidine synthase